MQMMRGLGSYQLGLVYAKLRDTEKSKQAFAEFERLRKKEDDDSQAATQAADEEERNHPAVAEHPQGCTLPRLLQILA